ncbi:MAG TPA: hypothetical protein PKV06_15915 [bacterium]|nr:hypothetical protein [bacterium]
MPDNLMIELPILKLMPAIAKYFIRCALVFLLLSILIQTLTQVGPHWGWTTIHNLQPVFFHFFLFGWVMQMIIGVSLWMFPWQDKAQFILRDRVGWFALLTINSGLVLRGVCEPFLDPSSGDALRFALTASVILMWLGCVVYAAHIWQRVRSK